MTCRATSGYNLGLDAAHPLLFEDQHPPGDPSLLVSAPRTGLEEPPV